MSIRIQFEMKLHYAVVLAAMSDLDTAWELDDRLSYELEVVKRDLDQLPTDEAYGLELGYYGYSYSTIKRKLKKLAILRQQYQDRKAYLKTRRRSVQKCLPWLCIYRDTAYELYYQVRAALGVPPVVPVVRSQRTPEEWEAIGMPHSERVAFLAGRNQESSERYGQHVPTEREITGRYQPIRLTKPEKLKKFKRPEQILRVKLSTPSCASVWNSTTSSPKVGTKFSEPVPKFPVQTRSLDADFDKLFATCWG